MGFKKPGVKKKKKKQKSAAEREWAFEGGQTIEETGVERNQPVMEGGRMRRQTQDRDERLRRGRQKIEMRRERDKFRAKMARKVLFTDKEESEIKQSRPKKKVRIEPPVSSNPMPIFERLQAMIATSRGEAYGERSGSDSEGSEDEDFSGNDQDGYEKETTEDASDDEEASDESEDDDDKGEVNLVGYYDWFFSSVVSEDSAAVERKGQQLGALSGTPDCTLTGWLHPAVSPPSIRRVGDIPGLHKLWCERGDEPIGRYEGQILSYLSCYADMFVEVGQKKDEATADYNAELRASLRHVVAHVMRARSIVIRNDQHLKKTAALSKAIPITKTGASAKMSTRRSRAEVLGVSEDKEDEIGENSDATLMLQDSGYTRARVLILTPLRSSALRIINQMVDLLDRDGGCTTVVGADKLDGEYGMSEEDLNATRAENKNKPADWQAIFSGNVDDDFKMGIQINPGQGKSTGTSAGKAPLVRLYSDFLVSDVIVASPLGLRLALEKAAADKSCADFLSSVEIVLISQADVMLMQNWDHMEFVLRMCNCLPKEDHGTDFSRIRPYFLDGKAAEYRQMVMLSSFQDPSLQAAMRECARSRAGVVRAKRDRRDGCVSTVVSRVKQIFSIVPVTSLLSEDDERFQYFCDSVLNKLLRLRQSHTLIVTPSYLSYVRVRNELIKRDANAAFVCEYSRESEISRGRSLFFHGNRDILLYSGRAHFFRRFRIRGALHLIFYSLPEYAHFYPEIVNNLGEGGAHGTVTSCLVLCSKYEKLALERIVGSKSLYLMQKITWQYPVISPRPEEGTCSGPTSRATGP